MLALAMEQDLRSKVRTVVSLAVLVIILILVALPFTGLLTRQETRLIQLTDGPYEIYRERDSVQLTADVVLYSRVGTRYVKDNASGQMVKTWDNGTYVLDLEDGTEVRISDHVLEAQVHDQMVVWTEGQDIMLLNSFTGSKKALPLSGARPLSRPSIHGDVVVWTDTRNDPDPFDNEQVADIYMFDLTTETESRLTTVPSEKGPPSVWGDLVAWTDGRGQDFDIYAFNITNGTEMRITTDPHAQSGPKVSSQAIVWVDLRASSHEWSEDLFYLDLKTWEERQASTSGMVESFDVWGSKIVWGDLSLENRPFESGDVLVYDIQKNRTRLHFASDWGQWSPSIWGKRIVWVDGIREGGEIFDRQRIERPIFGFDVPTLLALLATGSAILIIGLAFLAQQRREDRSRERVVRKRDPSARRPKERQQAGRGKDRAPRSKGGRRTGPGRPPPGQRGAMRRR